MKTLVVFSHGKESGPWGSKIMGLAEVAQAAGAEVISVDYQQDQICNHAPDHDDAVATRRESERRVAQLLDTPLPAHDRLILVGSSMGGYVSTVASAELNPAGLFLLAPAVYLANYAVQDPIPRAGKVMIVHGWGDEVVPPENVIRFARQHRSTLHLLDGDHRLQAALSEIKRLFGDFLRDVIGY